MLCFYSNIEYSKNILYIEKKNCLQDEEKNTFNLVVVHHL